MSYLLDTNVVSETRRRRPDGKVMAWIHQVDPQEIFVSVLTLGELAKGIAKRRDTDPQGAAALERWLEGLQELFSDRIIPVDTTIAIAWGKLVANRTLPVIDSLLAATAQVRGLTLVTRNVRDIRPTGGGIHQPMGRELLSWLEVTQDGGSTGLVAGFR